MRVYGFGVPELVVLGIIAIVAYVFAIKMFVDLAKKNGYYENSGSWKLWVLGIFFTPLVLGIYVLALFSQKN